MVAAVVASLAPARAFAVVMVVSGVDAGSDL